MAKMVSSKSLRVDMHPNVPVCVCVCVCMCEHLRSARRGWGEERGRTVAHARTEEPGIAEGALQELMLVRKRDRLSGFDKVPRTQPLDSSRVGMPARRAFGVNEERR